LDIKGKRALKLLFKANKRNYRAYRLKESFGKLWDYKGSGNAERFFYQREIPASMVKA